VGSIFENDCNSEDINQDGDISKDFFDGFKGKTILAGHIHIPQKVGNVTYVGSPYPIKYTRNWERMHSCLLVDPTNGATKEFYYTEMKKVIISINKGHFGFVEAEFDGITRDDQIKVEVELSSDEIHFYPELRSEILGVIKKRNLKYDKIKHKKIEKKKVTRVRLNSRRVSSIISNRDFFDRFSNSEGLSNTVREIGINIMEKGDLNEQN
jgi:hypothetical protein